jgi:SAM-dependent methyltransferase
MNPEQREQVRSNAKYLRNVRPLDPEEISEYVEGQPHPAVVRQVIRDESFDLGVVERDDGTFEPAPEGTISVDFRGVEAFPEHHASTLEELLVEEFGVDWPDGESGQRLRERIRQIKDRYLRQVDVTYDELTALAYALYHLPDYYAATQYVVADLARDGLLERPIRVLDVGAGVGGPALGLLDVLPDDTLVDYHAVEPSAAADILESLLDGYGPNVRRTVHRTTAEAFDVAEYADRDGEFDLIVFGNVLSELEEPESVLRTYLDGLATDGSLVALAPADRNTAIQLREVERAVADRGPATVYRPTVRLWPGDSPGGESWSFDVKPDLAVPEFQQRLAEAAPAPDSPPNQDADEFVNVDVQYAYSVLRRDGKQAIQATGDREFVAKMADAEKHVTNRVDLIGIKLSHDLTDGGNPLYLVGDGSQDTDHFAVLTHETSLTTDLKQAGYGNLLFFENALVLWNDDEEAYNVVVDDQTVVDAA